MAGVLSLKAVAQSLDRVYSVGQAQAAARSGLAEYDALHTTISHLAQVAQNPWEGFSWKGLDVAAKKVKTAAAALNGPPGTRVRYTRPDGGPGKEEPTWAALHAALLQLYGEVYAAQLREPGATWRDAPGILSGAIGDAAGVAKKVVRTVAKGVGEVAAGAAGIGGSVIWAVLKPLLPAILIVAGVVTVALVGVSVARKQVTG